MRRNRFELHISNKLLISWVVSYVVILLVPILAGAIMYHQSIEKVRVEVSKAHTASLLQYKAVMDGNIDVLARISSVSSLSQPIRNTLYVDEPLAARDILNIINAQKEIGRFSISTEFIDDIYIYANKNQSFYSSAYKYNTPELPSIISTIIYIEPLN